MNLGILKYKSEGIWGENSFGIFCFGQLSLNLMYIQLIYD